MHFFISFLNLLNQVIHSQTFQFVKDVRWRSSGSENVAVGDFWKRVWGWGVSRVVYHDGTSAVSITKNPMSVVAYMHANNFTLVNFGFDITAGTCSIISETNLGEFWVVDLVVGDISVGFEPFIELSGVVVVTGSRKAHGDGWKKAARYANSIARCSQLIISPSAIALFKERIGSGKGQDQKCGQK